MPPVVPDPKTIRSFRDAAAFEAWLARNHARARELWLKIHKKSSGLPTVTHDQALDVALSWGWIDGLRKAFDDRSFLQRFTPRTAKSPWSQVNRDRVLRLIAAGRMTPHGQRQVDAAKADGRWDAAPEPIRGLTTASMPPDLLAAIAANPRAQKAFRGIGRRDLVGLILQMRNVKTSAARARTIARLVAALASRGSVAADGRRRRGRQ